MGLVGQADRHDQVAVVVLVLAVGVYLGGDHGWLRCRGEGEPDVLGLDHAQALHKVVRVEGDSDVIAGQLGFEFFGGLGVFAGAGVQVQLALR